MTAILKVDTIQDTAGNNIINESSDTITIGASGDTITVPTGASLTLPGLTLSDNILFDTASKGIYLGVTSATAANLLDDYEEGTFTPTIASGITSVGYSSRWGQYTKIGNTVSFSFNIQTNAGTLNSSRLKFGGLPFNVSGSVRGFAVFNFVDGDFINSKTNNLPTLVFEPNPTIEAYFTDGTQFLGTDLTNASGNNIYIAGVYESV